MLFTLFFVEMSSKTAAEENDFAMPLEDVADGVA